MTTPESFARCTSIEQLTVAVRRFAEERHWQSVHSPKNLASALIVEAAELLEHFQWLSQDESRSLPSATRSKVAGELADVLIYLTRLADQLGIDLLVAASEKLALNGRKYPVQPPA